MLHQPQSQQSQLRQTDGPHCASLLEQVFADCFEKSWNTRLIGGATEPSYQPSGNPAQPHCLYYREDFFASALHETAHWCIAGPQRRLLPDFGYWYAPEGRDAQAQANFEAVEYKPQALEWIFSRACAYPFRPSLDNLQASGEMPDSRAFAQRIVQQIEHWQCTGLPDRAGVFFARLGVVHGNNVAFNALRFGTDQLDW